MKIFLVGEYDQNAGPSNVNRAIVKNAGKELLYRKSKNKIIRLLESMIKAVISDRILISGACAPKWYYFLKVLGKRYSYLMHGDLSFENKINRLHMPKAFISTQRKVLAGADHIICVSEKYSEWVKNRYPEYADRITFVNNGIELKRRPKLEKIPYTVAVSGGNRCIKNNGEVYRAVKMLREQGIPCKLYIFGRKYPDNDQIEENEYVEYCGHLDKKQYYKRLDTINCFILNSELEPFGLVVADAMNCNCSLIMTQYVGGASIMHCLSNDIIRDPHNIKEIADKIRGGCEHPNADRLWASIDVDSCSAKAAYQKLKNIIEA